MVKLASFREEIIDLYVNQGLSMPKIADKFNCSRQAIHQFLTRNNVKAFKVALHKDIIIDLYVNQGLSTVKIAEKFNCSGTPILNLLKSNNIKMRSPTDYVKGRSKLNQFKEEIIDSYKQGLSTYKIAAKLNCCHDSIRRFLKRNNVKLRTISEARLGFNINQYRDKIIDLYVRGETPYKISKKFNCNHITMKKYINKIKLDMGLKV